MSWLSETRGVGAALALLCLTWGLVCSSPASAELRAGAARVSITPDPRELPYTLGGYGDLKRLRTPATGIHDTCYARALVLASGASRCAIVSLDLCFLPANVKEAVATRIGETGIPKAALLLCATHTHSGPEPLRLHSGNTGATGDLPSFDPHLLDWMAGRIAQAVLDADRKLAPATLGSGQTAPVGLNRNRRGEPRTDDEMTVLKVADPQGHLIAALVDYAAHPTFYGAGMFEVSGDWAGAFERMMEATLPGATVLFVNGVEGDASPRGADEGTPAERIQIYAARVAQTAHSLLARIAQEGSPRLEAWNQTVELPAPQPHPLFLLAATQMRATPDQARALVERMMPRQCEVSFLRIGELLLIGVPGEPTTPVGLAAKEMARARGIQRPAVVALTNGWLGYLVTDTQYRAGKYEPTMSFYGPTIGARMLAGIQAGLERH